MTALGGDRYESGGNDGDVAERRAALLRALSKTAAQCKADHTNLFLEWGGSVEMAATHPESNTSSSRPFGDAIPREVFRVVVGNSAKQRTGLVLFVRDNAARDLTGVNM